MGLFDFLKPKPQLNLEEELRLGRNACDRQDWTSAREHLLPAARAGNTEAMWRLFYPFILGYGSGEKPAVEWLQKSAEGGNVDGQLLLAQQYLKGVYPVLAKNPAKAEEWYLEAVGKGSDKAMLELGRLYLYGKDGVRQDEGLAVALLTNVTGEPELYYAQYELKNSALYRRMLRVQSETICEEQLEQALKYWKKEDYTSARPLVAQAAEAGNARAQFMLGIMYRKGDGGLEQDLAKSLEWFRKAAESGHTDACYWVGAAYNSGEGVEKNEAEAIKWFLPAAEEGKATAQFELGIIYLLGGTGVERDALEAQRWLTKAAEQDHMYAQYYLSVVYELQGKTLMGTKWLKKAAESGMAEAAYRLVLIYRNYEEPMHVIRPWLEKAAELGHKKAIRELEMMD